MDTFAVIDPNGRLDGTTTRDGPSARDETADPLVAGVATAPDEARRPDGAAATAGAAAIAGASSGAIAGGRLRGRFRLGVPRVPGARSTIALAVGLAAGAALAQSGWMAESAATLGEMGFDPDRAALITSLVGCFAGAAAAALITGSRVAPIVASVGILGVLFGPTFQRETSAAAISSGADGVFNPSGWGMTAFALVAVAAALGWIAIMLVRPVRTWLLGTGGLASTSLRSRHLVLGAIGRPVAVAAVVAVVIVSGPVVADMLNFSPDARMRQGGVPGVALFQDGAPVGGSGPEAATGLPQSVENLVPAPVPGVLVTKRTASEERPWLIWKPGGPGRVEIDQLPAMWVGGTTTTAEVAVYLPPGYDQGNRRYPVLYEMPWSLSTWTGALQITSMLDTLISGGRLPASIVVFVSSHGGPYPDSECVDSYDGTELFDTYVTKSVVPWVDGHFRTIATPDARTIFGFSVGGFCAPSMVLRHPDLFRQAVAFDGYFVAAPSDVQTINAWRPFGNETARIAAASPLNLASGIQPDVRERLFIVLAGDPSSRFYGPQMQAFAEELDRVEMPFAWVPSDQGHAWAAVRQTFASAMESAALRQAQHGVFRP